MHNTSSIRLVVSIQYRQVTDGQTHNSIYHASIVSRDNNDNVSRAMLSRTELHGLAKLNTKLKRSTHRNFVASVCKYFGEMWYNSDNSHNPLPGTSQLTSSMCIIQTKRHPIGNRLTLGLCGVTVAYRNFITFGCATAKSRVPRRLISCSASASQPKLLQASRKMDVGVAEESTHQSLATMNRSYESCIGLGLEGLE